MYRGILEVDVAVAVKVLRLPQADAAGPEVKAALQRAFDRPADMPAVVHQLKALHELVTPPASAVAPLLMCELCLEEVLETHGLHCQLEVTATASGAGAGAGGGVGGAAGLASSDSGRAPHFFCLPCLQRQVLDCATVQQLTKTEGTIPCPDRECAARAWTLADLKPYLDKDTLVAYGTTLAASMFDAARAKRESEAQQAAREAAARDAAVALDERVRRSRALIVERDLMLHCPR